ncbi:biopolymer transporter ExbD, partial [Acidithiobacillus sp. MC2.1]
MQYLEMRKGRVEIIPMIDIMLFLLIFFIMVTIHMIPTQGLPAQMPGSSTARDLPKPKVVLTLRQSGAVETDGHTISLPDLEARLRQGDPAETQVTIAADKGA